MSAPHPHLTDIDHQLARTGMAIRGVRPSPWSAGWHHTIGLLDHGHPEVCVLGLPADLAVELLVEVHRRAHGGEALVPDLVRRLDVGPLVGAAVREVPRADVLGGGAPLGEIDLWYGTVGYPVVHGELAVQVVAADLDGSMPWERAPVAHPDQPVLADGDPVRWGGPPPAWHDLCCPRRVPAVAPGDP